MLACTCKILDVALLLLRILQVQPIKNSPRSLCSVALILGWFDAMKAMGRVHTERAANGTERILYMNAELQSKLGRIRNLITRRGWNGVLLGRK